MQRVLEPAVRRLTQRPGSAIQVAAIAALGVALVVSLTSLLAGLEELGLQRLRAVGADVVRIGRPAGISPADLAQLNDESAVIVDQVACLAESSTQRRGASLVLTEPGFRELFDYPLHSGRFLNDDDGGDSEPACVLAGALAAKLFGEADPVGQQVSVRVGRVRLGLVVCGVLVDLNQGPSAGVYGGFPQHTLYVHQGVLAGFAPRSVALTQPPAGVGVDVYAERLRRVASELWPAQSFAVSHEVWAVGVREHYVLQIAALGAGLSVLTVLACIASVLTIQLLQLRGRLSEIAIRVIEGATPREVAGQFVLESVLASGVGGVGGVALGVLIAQALSEGYLGWPASFSSDQAWFAVGATLATGVLSAVLPAWRAARLDPVVALRVAQESGQ